jgi:CheB methylesterase
VSNSPSPSLIRGSPWVIVIGASAGGVQALSRLVEGLPENLSAAVYIVLHISARSPSHLHEILGRCSKLPVSVAGDGDPIRPGQIVVARADRHLMVERDRIRVTRGPTESRVRPAIDVLFRSAAFAHGRNVIGVLLTGCLDDGTAGLWAIKDHGGVALVQDPASADFPGMPRSAISNVEVDHVLALEDLASELVLRLQEGVDELSAPAPQVFASKSGSVSNESAYAIPDLENQALSGASAAQITGSLADILRRAEKCLTPVIGPQAFVALYKRSLVLTGRSHVSLAGLDGTVQSDVALASLMSSLSKQASTDAAVEDRDLLQTFYELVKSLIGSSLSSRLLQLVSSADESQPQRFV